MEEKMKEKNGHETEIIKEKRNKTKNKRKENQNGNVLKASIKIILK